MNEDDKTGELARLDKSPRGKRCMLGGCVCVLSALSNRRILGRQIAVHRSGVRRIVMKVGISKRCARLVKRNKIQSLKLRARIACSQTRT